MNEKRQRRRKTANQEIERRRCGDWIAAGKAPEAILAANPQKNFTRPLCARPALAFYKGEGDPNAAASFACRATGTRTASTAR
jgi:hypothetical protein